MFLKKMLSSKAGFIISYLYLIFSFGILDVWLRVVTRWIGAYSIFEFIPNLFTLLWAIVLTAVVTIVPSVKPGRILYAIIYFIFMIYTIVQYGAYLVLGKFLFISDFMLAAESAGYASWAIDLLSPAFLAQIFALIVIGILGIFLYPRSTAHQVSAPYNFAIRLAVVAICCCVISLIPTLYKKDFAQKKWGGFLNPESEYERFLNSNFDMELTGLYQYIARDIQIQITRQKRSEEKIQLVSTFFESKEEHTANDMTGLFEGKNLIVVMMESIDDWMITEADTPTLYQMQENSIFLKNMYTPQYTNGYTFNTEFAFNTSVFSYSNGNPAYSLSRNCFNLSISTKFKNADYSTESFHEGFSSFYNRGTMHSIWGYEKYHSYSDFPETAYTIFDDRFLPNCDELYEEITAEKPFFSFIITYSPHLPYTDDDPLTQTALAAYPQYDVEEDREVNILRAKARLTDDMFAGLIQRLETDGILEDTVIVVFSDHYAYGLSDQERLQQLSSQAGSDILERTPAFIYCAGSDLSMKVEKISQITDLAPTILNLFGLEVPKEIMGQDIFSENYEGYAIFPNGTWLTELAYVKNGIVQWNNGMTEDEISAMNSYVKTVYQVNDAILDSDYYSSIDN